MTFTNLRDYPIPITLPSGLTYDKSTIEQLPGYPKEVICPNSKKKVLNADSFEVNVFIKNQIDDFVIKMETIARQKLLHPASESASQLMSTSSPPPQPSASAAAASAVDSPRTIQRRHWLDTFSNKEASSKSASSSSSVTSPTKRK